MPGAEISACFTGHREIPPEELPRLREHLLEVLEAAWRKGIRHFYNGGALGFDMLAAELVVALRQRHEDVTLEIVIPHSHQSDGWTARERMRYERLLYLADQLTPLSPLYYQGCYHTRNRYMVDRSSLCLCYYRFPTGGTAYTVSYASRQQVTLVNLALESSWSGYLTGE